MSHQLYKREGSHHWWISIKVKGRKRIRRSSGTAERAKAQALAKNIEAKEWERLTKGDSSVLTFSEAAVIYAEEGHSQRFLPPLISYFRDRPVVEIKAGHIRAAAREIYPGATTATWNRQVLTPAQAVINYAASKDLAEPVRVERFRELRPVRKAPGPGWMDSFMAAAEPRVAALAFFMMTTAARIGQATSVDWQAVDLAAGTVNIPPAKGFPERKARLTPEMVAMLANLPGDRHGRVFGYQGKSGVYKPWRAACEAAGIELVMPHSAGRRAFATIMAQNGVGPKTAAKLGGWSSVKLMLEIYTDADDDAGLIDDVFGTNQTQSPAEVTPMNINNKAKTKL